jgi:diguanylate cyclase (GGDEF)-like protein
MRSHFNSLRSALMAVVVLSGGIGLGVFTVTMSWINTNTSIRLLDQRLATLADMTSQNSMAALDFGDKKDAGEVLQALQTEPAVITACLYNRHGELFSHYERRVAALPCPRTAAQGGLPGKNYREIHRLIRHSDDVVGSVYLVAEMRTLRDRNRRGIILAIELALFSIVIAAAAGAFLQRRISKPVGELARAMRKVTAEDTFGAQVQVNGPDEIAQLAAGFNQMITELERRQQIAREAEVRLSEQARTDALTGLPNRRYLAEQLERELARASRQHQLLGLLYIDLDGFKLVNDSLGHYTGDLLLRQVADRFRTRVRASDTLARLGGDEFTVILTGLRAEEDATHAANSLIECLAQPFVVEGHQITVGASVGITTRLPYNSTDSDLLKQADSAMYAAKSRGKNKAVHFSPELGRMARERLLLENELRGAIGRNEIYVEYQPEFSVESGRLVCFEALARWRHPHLGDISPATFVPIAEESGLMHGIGEFVMEHACRECLRWQTLPGHPVQVAVNVSAIQFNSENFVEVVSSVLKRTGLAPQLLQIELTESVMVGLLDHSSDKMMRLRSLGVGLAMDDFGTGYSSLGYLSGLPFTAFKIDRTFVRDLRPNSTSLAMIQSMIDLGHKLNMRVIVEGIEDEAQLETVTTMGADDAQGYLLGEPSADPIVDFAHFLRGERLSLSMMAKS